MRFHEAIGLSLNSMRLALIPCRLTALYRIKRYHIQQTAMRRQVEIEDDLYDF